MGEKVPVFVHRAALHRNVGPQRGKRLLEAGSAVNDDQFGVLSPRLTRHLPIDEGSVVEDLPLPVRQRAGTGMTIRKPPGSEKGDRA